MSFVIARSLSRHGMIVNILMKWLSEAIEGDSTNSIIYNTDNTVNMDICQAVFILAGVKKTIYSEEQGHFLALLRQVRQNAGLTQADLAKQLGVPQSRVSDYERGERQMDLMQLRQYCLAVQVELVEFVQRFDAMVKADLKTAK